METPAIAALLVDSPPREENPAGATVEKDIEEMTRGMRAGDAAAWNEFHRRYYLALLRAAAARGNSLDSESIVQSAYLRVARHIKPFRREEDFWRWLCCLVRCAAADLRRERTRSNLLLERFRIWTELWIARHRSVPHSDLADSLDEAMHALDENDAALLRRKYCEGWSTAELARENDCTEKSIEARLARLRAGLKTQLTGGTTHA